MWVGRDSSVGTATRYGMDGPGIESRWRARFSVPVQTFPGVHPASGTMGTGSFQGVKRPGRGVDHPPPFRAEVKERVQLYLYSPYWPSWPVLGRILPLPLRKICGSFPPVETDIVIWSYDVVQQSRRWGLALPTNIPLLSSPICPLPKRRYSPYI